MALSSPERIHLLRYAPGQPRRTPPPSLPARLGQLFARPQPLRFAKCFSLLYTLNQGAEIQPVPVQPRYFQIMDTQRNTRRSFLNSLALGSGLLLAGCKRGGPNANQENGPSEIADVTLHIGPVLVDIAKDHTI